MLQYICIYIIYWKTHSSANCLYLIMGPLSMEMVKQTAVQLVSTWKFALHKKNCVIKRGLGRKNHTGKKSQRIHDEKRAMCAWDHWNSIGANPARYCCEFATSKTPRIRAMCVMSFMIVIQKKAPKNCYKGLYEMCHYDVLPVYACQFIRVKSFVYLWPDSVIQWTGQPIPRRLWSYSSNNRALGEAVYVGTDVEFHAQCCTQTKGCGCI